MVGNTQEKIELGYSFPFSLKRDMTAEEFEPLSSNANEDTGNIVIVAENIEDVYTEFLSKIPYLFTYKAHHFLQENMLVR